MLLALSQDNIPSAHKSVDREGADPLVAYESPDFGFGWVWRERNRWWEGEAGRFVSVDGGSAVPFLRLRTSHRPILQKYAPNVLLF